MVFDSCKKIYSFEIMVLMHVTSPTQKKTIFDVVDVLRSSTKTKAIHSVQQVQDLVWLKEGSESIPINFCTD